MTPGTPGKSRLRKAVDLGMAVFFVAYLVIGLLLVPNYGLSADDEVQRKHSLVNYKYINKVLLGRDVPGLENVVDLAEYDQYYGVALQMPMVLYEDLNHFSLSKREIYLSRHYCIFVMCVLGMVFFYLALRKIFPESPAVPAFGTLMVALYPRFFGGQFVDVKNRLFAATCMLVLWLLVMAVETKKPVWQILFGFGTALAVNTRVMAVIFPALYVGYFLCVDVTEAVLRKRHPETAAPAKKAAFLWKYVIAGLAFLAFWFMITPKAWTEGNPVFTLFATFRRFSHFDHWNGTMVFMGRKIRCSGMPWYYLFVWFALTIPVLFLLLFALGHGSFLRRICRSKTWWQDLLTTHKWFACAFALFWGSIWAVILLHSRIYVGWHHLYFVFVPMVVLMCYGLEPLLRREKLRPFAAGALAVNLALLGVWIARNHTWETAYFNVVGSQVAEKFDRGETKPSTLGLCRWILANEPGEFTVQWNKTSYPLLTDEEKRRVTQTSENPDYIIENFRNRIGNEYEYEGYEEVYAVWINRYKVGAVYKRLEGYEAAQEEGYEAADETEEVDEAEEEV